MLNTSHPNSSTAGNSNQPVQINEDDESAVPSPQTLTKKPLNGLSNLWQKIRRWRLVIIGLVLLCSSVGLGLFWQLQPTSTSVNLEDALVVGDTQNASSSNNGESALAELLTANQTSGTYTNEYCNYSFDYPDNWLLLNESTENEVNSVLLASEPITAQNQQSVFRVQVACSQIDPSQSPSVIIDALLARYEQQNAQVSARQTAHISNNAAFHHQITLDSGTIIKEYYIFGQPGRVIIMSFQPYQQALDELVQQITSTIQVGE
ncbi:MAG: PsbP-related protein [Patescibacteria group bacterium]